MSARMNLSGAVASACAIMSACMMGCQSVPPAPGFESYLRPLSEVPKDSLPEPTDGSTLVRPIDAVVEGGRLWLAIEAAGESGSNIRSFAPAAYLASQIHETLRNDKWILTSHAGRVSLAKDHRTSDVGPRYEQWGSHDFPQVPFRPERNRTAFWIWMWLEGDAPTDVAIVRNEIAATPTEPEPLQLVDHQHVAVRR
jgi:hypothetical protein